LWVAWLLLAAPAVVRGQDPARASGGYWRRFALGFASSILVHEAAHVGASLAMGSSPSFGFDRLRPTVYSGIDAQREPHKQFLFSSAGLNAQSVLDELILDVPHERGSAFERGVLAGGIGTTAFYLMIGRWGYVSDVDFMARTGALNKTQITLIYGTVAVLQTWRISRDARYADFFIRPARDGSRLLVGTALSF
jgi:hypothetical protein